MKSSNTRLAAAALSLMIAAGAFAAGNPHGMAPTMRMHQPSTMQGIRAVLRGRVSAPPPLPLRLMLLVMRLSMCG